MRLLIGVLLILVLTGTFLAFSSLRAERRLDRASLAELDVQAQRAPGDLRVQYHLARRARADKQYALSLESYKRVALSDPANESVWVETAQTAAADQRIPLAVNILYTFCQRNPDSVLGHAALAEMLVESHAAKPALDEADAALRLDPQSGEAWLAEGQAAAALVNSEQAQGAYTQALAQGDQARNAFQRAISLAPNDWRGYAGLGSLDDDLTRYREAIAPLRRAVALNPNDGLLLSRLGSALILVGPSLDELQEAAQYLQRAAALKDGMSPGVLLRTYLYLAQAYQQQSRWRDALPWLEKAAALDPQNAQVHYELARVYQGLGDPADAARETQRHEALSERDITRQRLAYRVMSVPSDSPARMKLAHLYAASGDDAAAVAQYRAVLEHNPHAVGARQEMDALQRAHAPPPPNGVQAP